MNSYKVLNQDAATIIERPNISVADNRNIDPRIVIIFVLCTFIGFIVLGISAYIYTELPAPVIIILDLILLFRFAKWFLPQMTGDAAALREIESFDKNQRLQILSSFKLEKEARQYQHVEDMAKIDATRSLEETRLQMQELHVMVESIQRRLITDSAGQTQIESTNSFVPAYSERIKKKALEWVHGLYIHGAGPDPKQVNENGFIFDGVPFSSRGKWKGADRSAARTFLMEEGIITKKEKSANYYLNVKDYPTSAAVSHKFI